MEKHYQQQLRKHRSISLAIFISTLPQLASLFALNYQPNLHLTSHRAPTKGPGVHQAPTSRVLQGQGGRGYL